MPFPPTVCHYLNSCSAHDVSFTTQSILYMCVVPCLFLPQCAITSTLVPQMTFHSRHKASLTVATLLSDLRDIHYLAFFGIKASQQKSFSSLNAVWLPFGCDGSFTKIGDCCPLYIPRAMISKRGCHFYHGHTIHAVLSCDCCVLALFLLWLLCSCAVLSCDCCVPALFLLWLLCSRAVLSCDCCVLALFLLWLLCSRAVLSCDCTFLCCS